MSGDAWSDLFDGPGEVRRELRSLDWASTPLGPVREWPQVLRVMVAVCLDSGFPIVVSWGPDVVLLYNDAYLPLLGGHKHPQALARPAKEVWPEHWNVTGPMTDAVLERGRTIRRDNMQMLLDRNGYLEECYFTFSHSPIRLDDGSVGGMFTVATETTGHLLYDRRLDIVRRLGALSTTGTGSAADTCVAALDVLAQTRTTAPFAAAFLRDASDRLTEVGSYGLTAGARLVAAEGDLNAVVQRVVDGGVGETMSGLRVLSPAALEPGPLGPLVPDAAVVLPLLISGDDAPVGAFVLGVNPYRQLDESYRKYFSLVGRQLNTAVTDTLAYQRRGDLLRAMADLDRVKTEFFENVSHELRTPLSLLLAPLQDLLAPDQDLTDRQRDRVELAVRAAQRLRRMVDALLDFAQAEAGALAPHLETVDLARIVVDTASMFRAATEAAGLDLTVAVPEGQVAAQVDPAMFATIVTNLLSNAVKFTERGGVTVELHTTAGGNQGAVTLDVRDTGVGIPADEQRRVFDRLYRSAGSETGEGSGIGLALVSYLVKAHHGRVELVSAAGVGSTFTVVLPVTDAAGFDDPALVPAVHDDTAVTAPAHDEPKAAGEVDDQASVPAEARSRLLLVEDDLDLQRYLTELLTDDGWDVTAVSDAEAADREIALAAPDLILTDIMMPGRSGLELVADLRAAAATARLPIIVLTARGGTAAAADGLAAGADDYITKPFAADELLARVRANHELYRIREDAVSTAEQRADNLSTALDRNRTIGTAVGIVMSGQRLEGRSAFQLLVKASQDTNRKLYDIAGEVVQAGALPFRPTVIDDLVLRVSTPRR